jgi:hypothetical protein
LDAPHVVERRGVGFALPKESKGSLLQLPQRVRDDLFHAHFSIKSFKPARNCVARFSKSSCSVSFKQTQGRKK